jgi:2-aminoadipate transaminase
MCLFADENAFRNGPPTRAGCACAFDNPSHETIRSGVAALAEVCRREFGVPSRIANVERARA